MPTFKLTLEYDGSHYAGWQRQPGHPTIQAAIEEVLERIAQVRIPIVGAGRTDAGVHALGQVASFKTTRELAPYQWLRASNSYLPKDISVRSVEQVPDSFHARYSARGKQYDYHILNRSEHSPLQRHRAWTIYRSLDVARMAEAAARLVGTHDFSSFEGSPTDNENPHCHLHRLDVKQLGETIVIAAYADRFLKQMVRAIIGTLVEVGLQKRTVESMETILDARHRSAAGQTAPPHGLYLMRVEY